MQHGAALPPIGGSSELAARVAAIVSDEAHARRGLQALIVGAAGEAARLRAERAALAAERAALAAERAAWDAARRAYLDCGIEEQR